MREIVVWGICCVLIATSARAQVDTTFIYNNSTPYGSLDIRIANSVSWYYYLQEGKTFSFRETGGTRTNTFRDMTSWDSSPYIEGNLREKNGASDEFVMNYRYLIPENYNPDYQPGYPLVIIFHGLGEAGNCSEHNCYHAGTGYSPRVNDPPAPTDSEFQLLNNDHQLSNGGNFHLGAMLKADGLLPNNSNLDPRSFPGFVIFPQNLKGWDVSTVQHAIRLIRLFAKKYNVDEDRIYIEGISNGGHGVFEALKRAPWLFAAGMTMSAIDDAFINTQNVAHTVAHIPLWMFQGGRDKNPYPSKTENNIKKFRDAGAVIKYSLYPNVGHGTWGTAYNEPEFFIWMLGKNKRQIHAFGGNPVICGGNPVQLEVGAGFKAYQWQRNQQTISGATSHSIQADAPGKYRVRFSRVANPAESQWNEWSDEIEVTTGEPPQKPEIIQYGTVLLRDLNNLNEARLEAKGNWNHYYWFKNGNLVDFPGDQDDTIKFARIPASAGSGAYTLSVANFKSCTSTFSDVKHVFFNNEASLSLNTPGTFSATAQPSAKVDLQWADVPNDQGYEIWRRRKLANGSFEQWEMAVLTQANTSSYTDAGIYPLTTYQYKLRAVSTSSRSDYTTETVEVTTTTDTEPPSAPANFTAKQVGVSKVMLSWSPSSDNSKVHRYFVYYGEDSVSTSSGNDTTMFLTNVPVNQLFNFFVKAVDFSGNYSPPSNTRLVNTYLSGLFYSHSTGIFSSISTIDWSNPEFTGRVPEFTLSKRTQEDYFNFSFEGFLYIEKPGLYQFRVRSDDGSRLFINDTRIINNDGIHELRTMSSSSRELSTGPHFIRLEYFEYVESDSLSVEYKGPDTNTEWRHVTNEVLKSAEHVITSIEEPTVVEKKKIVLYPNPTNTQNINIGFEDLIIQTARVQIIDMMGKIFHDELIQNDDNSRFLKIVPSEELIPGVYLILLRQKDETSSIRLVIKD